MAEARDDVVEQIRLWADDLAARSRAGRSGRGAGTRAAVRPRRGRRHRQRGGRRGRRGAVALLAALLVLVVGALAAVGIKQRRDTTVASDREVGANREEFVVRVPLDYECVFAFAAPAGASAVEIRGETLLDERPGQIVTRFTLPNGSTFSATAPLGDRSAPVVSATVTGLPLGAQYAFAPWVLNSTGSADSQAQDCMARIGGESVVEALTQTLFSPITFTRVSLELGAVEPGGAPLASTTLDGIWVWPIQVAGDPVWARSAVRPGAIWLENFTVTRDNGHVLYEASLTAVSEPGEADVAAQSALTASVAATDPASAPVGAIPASSSSSRQVPHAVAEAISPWVSDARELWAVWDDSAGLSDLDLARLVATRLLGLSADAVSPGQVGPQVRLANGVVRVLHFDALGGWRTLPYDGGFEYSKSALASSWGLREAYLGWSDDGAGADPALSPQLVALGGSGPRSFFASAVPEATTLEVVVHDGAWLSAWRVPTGGSSVVFDVDFTTGIFGEAVGAGEPRVLGIWRDDSGAVIDFVVGGGPYIGPVAGACPPTASCQWPPPFGYASSTALRTGAVSGPISGP